MSDFEARANTVFSLVTPEAAFEHFIAAGTLIVSPDGYVLLGGHYLEGQIGGEPYWGNAAGSREGVEPPWVTATRETMEEFGFYCPLSADDKPLILVAMEGREVAWRTLDIGICYLVVMERRFDTVLRYPGGEVERLRWFSPQETVQLTEAFTDDAFLWGGCWTEMVLRRWIEGEKKLSSFPGLITFPKSALERRPSAYRRTKLREAS